MSCFEGRTSKVRNPPNAPNVLPAEVMSEAVCCWTLAMIPSYRRHTCSITLLHRKPSGSFECLYDRSALTRLMATLLRLRCYSRRDTQLCPMIRR